MVHSPCGDDNPKCLCIMWSPPSSCKFSKDFPKSLSDQTLLAQNGNLAYSKGAGVGTFMTIQDPQHMAHPMISDNRWVDPYSPQLCKKYNAHNNVEVWQYHSHQVYPWLYIQGRGYHHASSEK